MCRISDGTANRNPFPLYRPTLFYLGTLSLKHYNTKIRLASWIRGVEPRRLPSLAAIPNQSATSCFLLENFVWKIF